jgi:hypothetical protein
MNVFVVVPNDSNIPIGAYLALSEAISVCSPLVQGACVHKLVTGLKQGSRTKVYEKFSL